MSLERLLLAAWIEQLEARNPEPAVRVVSSLADAVRLDDTGRARVIPLRPNGGDIAPAQSGDVLDALWWNA